MKKISIVMPVYNGEKYLRESIESILGQTCREWELILVNDCSKDGTLRIMREYEGRDPRIRVISNAANEKLPASLNIGFRAAEGEYYTWTSHDNRYKPKALEKMAEALAGRPGAGLVYADMDYIDEAGRKTGSVSLGEENLYYNDCVGACFLYRAEAARAVGEYDPGWFLVEDYEYWLRMAEKREVFHLPLNLYEYRFHGGSLTETKVMQVSRQLYRLWLERLDFLLERAGAEQAETLFIDMCLRDRKLLSFLRWKFYGGKALPEHIRWVERERKMELSRRAILFGAGDFGRKALEYIGEDGVAFFADNNPAMEGKTAWGKEVISFERLKRIHEDYEVVISVDARKVAAIASQLENAGMKEYMTYLEMAHHLKNPANGAGAAWLDAIKNAWKWVQAYSIEGEGIANNSGMRASYPEVTGYYIPTLMRWGFRDLALSYAKWLCSMQRPDGAWNDTEGRDPYVFDTAQALKGLLAVRSVLEGADAAIRKGCDWMLSNMEENGRLRTPSEKEWGGKGVCSELIHLYCLSPLMEASDAYGDGKYRAAAEKIADYYVSRHGDEIREFGMLSHFYAYVMEALCDIGREGLARESMGRMEELLDEKGYVPAYKGVNWVCSAGMFQLAIVWFKLGDLARGNKALNYAAKLQNESGGWYGSYPTTDRPEVTDEKEYPDYFAVSEISWAVKYFLDAAYYKNRLEFESQAHTFPDAIAEDDGRYQLVLQEAKSQGAGNICDVGCGKGRYLKNLLKDIPMARYCAVDMSEKVMDGIASPIEKRRGALTRIPYEDESFDMTYAVEALEHSVFPENAVKEMLRVTKPGGRVVIVDKNQSAMGLLEIDEWEQWFESELFEKIAEETGCGLRVAENVSYDGGLADGLFSAWVLEKRKGGRS